MYVCACARAGLIGRVGECRGAVLHQGLLQCVSHCHRAAAGVSVPLKRLSFPNCFAGITMASPLPLVVVLACRLEPASLLARVEQFLQYIIPTTCSAALVTVRCLHSLPGLSLRFLDCCVHVIVLICYPFRDCSVCVSGCKTVCALLPGRDASILRVEASACGRRVRVCVATASAASRLPHPYPCYHCVCQRGWCPAHHGCNREECHCLAPSQGLPCLLFLLALPWIYVGIVL